MFTTAPTPSPPPRPRVLLALVLLLVLPVLASCSDGSEQEPTTATVYLLNAEGALTAQELPVTDGRDPLRAALEALVDAPRDAGLSSGLPPGTRLISAERAGSIALVDLSQAFAVGFPAGGSQAQTEVLAPLVYTATADDRIESVSLTVEGAVPDIMGLAYDVEEPLTRDDVPAATEGDMG